MRRGTAGGDKLGGPLAGELHVEETIAVQMGELLSIAPEADTAEAMHRWRDTGESERSGFEGFDRAEALAMKKRGPREQQRVEELRRER